MARSLLNEAMHWEDERQFGSQIDRQPVAPPLIVLGLARSGTTLLHQLLAQDPRFAFARAAQAANPHTFLTREGLSRSALAYFLRACNLALSALAYRKGAAGQTRGVDNIRVGWDLPEEDETALLMSGVGPALSLFFPAQGQFFLRDDSAAMEVFQRCWMRFLKKLSFRYEGRPLVLKSPAHMSRIPYILDVLPQARFVFISRHPEEIYASMLRLGDFLSAFSFQSSAVSHWTGDVFALELPKRGYEAYLRDRSLIPAAQLHELRYEDLVQRPESVLEQVYTSLSLGSFEPVRGPLRQALADRTDYQVSHRSELSRQKSELLRRHWSSYFEAFGYS